MRSFAVLALLLLLQGNSFVLSNLQQQPQNAGVALVPVVPLQTAASVSQLSATAPTTAVEHVQHVQQQDIEPSARKRATFLALMAASTGLAHVVCFRRFGFFCNMVTGNTIRGALALEDLRYKDSLLLAAIVASYMVGSGLFRAIDLKQQQNAAATKTTTLRALIPVATVTFVLADVAGMINSLGLPVVLAAGFGIINGGTMISFGAITNAVSGHITKIGMGFADLCMTGKCSEASRTSAAFFAMFVASIVTSSAAYTWVVARPGWVSKMPPAGCTFGLVYAAIFWWYTRASPSVKESAERSEDTKSV